jgi:hypothetical protein
MLELPGRGVAEGRLGICPETNGGTCAGIFRGPLRLIAYSHVPKRPKTMGTDFPGKSIDSRLERKYYGKEITL